MPTSRLNKWTNGIEKVFFNYALRDEILKIHIFKFEWIENFLKDARKFIKSERADERDRFIGRLITQIERKKQPLTKEYLIDWLKNKRVTK